MVGEEALLLQADLFEGSVVDTARLDNFTIMFDHQKQMHDTGDDSLIQAAQSVRLKVCLKNPDAEAAAPPEEETA